jgi:hypothetical protein
MAVEEENLQAQVNQAVANEGETSSSTTEHETGADDNNDDSNEEVVSSQSTDEDDENSASAGNDDQGGGSASTDDDDDDDEDDDLFSPQVPGIGTSPSASKFDIRTLPRNEQGYVDPEAANAAITEYAENYALSKSQQAEVQQNVATQLTRQWQKVSEKYPHIAKNKDLRGLAREMHLTSIDKAQRGEGRYLSPIAAAKKVQKMYQNAVKQGVAQSNSRKRVVKAAGSESGSGKTPKQNGTSEYARLKEVATTGSPKEAAEARREILKIRMKARRSR